VDEDADSKRDQLLHADLAVREPQNALNARPRDSIFSFLCTRLCCSKLDADVDSAPLSWK